MNRLPAHLQMRTFDGKRPLPIALDALHHIANWRTTEPLSREAEIARAALAELGIYGAPNT
jgi:hypothetical protein